MKVCSNVAWFLTQISPIYSFHQTYFRWNSNLIQRPKLRSLKMVDDRFSENALNYMSQIRLGFNNTGKCSRCWLNRSVCICERVEALAYGKRKISANIDLFMHYKEWGRQSNTGKLLPLLSNARTHIYKFGVEAEHIELNDKLNSKPAILLYPTQSSEPISNYKSWYEQHNGDVSLCVLDTTWNLSHAMEKVIPDHVPRVNINEMVSQPSLFLLRKQSLSSHKISTIEAIYFALSALGESEDSLSPLLSALKLSVDVVSKLRGKPSVYGNEVMAHPSPHDTNGPYTARIVSRPGSCLCCGSQDDTLRNLGVTVERKNDTGEAEQVRVWYCRKCRQRFTVPFASATT